MKKAKVQVKSENYISRVHNFVRKVPRRKVTTYGAIAKALNINPRMVGYALHQNKNPKVPCHRVVNREGKVASGFAFGGSVEQKRRLEAEGVSFTDEMRVAPDCIWVHPE